MDYEVLCGEWGGNKASRLGGGNRTGVDMWVLKLATWPTKHCPP